MGGKIACVKDSAKNTDKSQLLQIQYGNDGWGGGGGDFTMVEYDNYLMCSLGYSCMCDYSGKSAASVSC